MTRGEGRRPPVRVAIVGLGRAAFADHYPFFREHPELFDVVCACDLLKARRDLVARDFPTCRMFRQFSEMLQEPGIDLVDIATPSVDHVAMAMQSLKRGFWTLVETPLALTMEECKLLRGQNAKSHNRLLVLQRELLSPDFLLARQSLGDRRLGRIHEIVIRQQDYLRRSDWQSICRLGGGAAYYAMGGMVLQAVKLLPSSPIQMWSCLNRILSQGDAEDFARVCLKSRDQVLADVAYSGGRLPSDEEPAFVIRGDRGVLKIGPGAKEGVLTTITSIAASSRRHSSVRTPSLASDRERVSCREERFALKAGTPCGTEAIWRQVYATVRAGSPYPLALEDSLLATKFSCLMKKNTAYSR